MTAAAYPLSVANSISQCLHGVDISPIVLAKTCTAFDWKSANFTSVALSCGQNVRADRCCNLVLGMYGQQQAFHMNQTGRAANQVRASGSIFLKKGGASQVKHSAYISRSPSKIWGLKPGPFGSSDTCSHISRRVFVPVLGPYLPRVCNWSSFRPEFSGRITTQEQRKWGHEWRFSETALPAHRHYGTVAIACLLKSELGCQLLTLLRLWRASKAISLNAQQN